LSFEHVFAFELNVEGLAFEWFTGSPRESYIRERNKENSAKSLT
jgi:hypothetical protein